MTTESLDSGPLDPAPPVSAEMRPCASYTLRVNGFERPVTDAWIGESLLYVLRERLGLAGAKDGCEQGECGACSVQVDGQLVAGCLVPAALAADSEINTVEGLSAGGAASDVQQALAESGAVQCGYCTPGMAMAVHDLLQRNHRPSEVEARQALCGNLCRCTGYRGVLAAVQTVAESRAAEAEQAEEGTAPAEEGAAERPAAAPVVTEQSAADVPLAGELPVYADSDAWVEHVPQPPAAGQPPAGHQGHQGHPGQPGAGPSGEHLAGPYGDGAGPSGGPTATGTGMGMAYAGHEQGGQPGAPYDTGVYDTAVLPPVPSFPVQQGPADQQNGQGYYQQPGYPEGAYAGPPAHGTPAHGTYLPGAPGYQEAPYEGMPYQVPGQQNGQQHGQQGGHPNAQQGVPYPGPAYRSGEYDTTDFEHAPYDGPVYESTPAHGTAFDGTGYDGTPAQGTPYIPTPPHGVPTDGAPAGVPYGADPAHGIVPQPSGTSIPEDRHA
ncbi:2Fe-2S iron-sulfur cluster-binding protein [Kitasatospora indigofera]|uniref:(2Fe-2S)-binding protein n=1 Tax=Kitasatospora indigofera TaxID=67307 RepID=UPI003680C570